MKKQHLKTGLVAGALLIGSAGVTILPSVVAAADPSPSPTAAASGATGSTSAATDRHGGPGGLDADDLTAAAQALGMSEADLTTALNSGKTAAAVAADQGVDVQKVIDAIVAADTAEIKAQVTAGTITQAQADERLANLAAHVTNEVNGTGGHDGGGRHSGPASPAPTSSTTTS